MVGADANRERIGSMEGALSAIVCGLRAHVDSAAVQKAGLAALENLAWESGSLMVVWRLCVPHDTGSRSLGAGEPRAALVRCW